MLIDELDSLIREHGIHVLRLAVYEDGREEERIYHVANDCNNIYSISKNFTAAAVGILFDRGLLTPDTRISALLGDLDPALWASLDPRWNDVTVRHLLTQSTGHGGMLLDMDCDDIYAYGTRDFLKKVLTTPLVYDPGTHFAYTDSNFYLLSRIVAAVTGETLQSFLGRELLWDLRVQGWAFSTCPAGHAMGGTRLFVRNKDLLHFGRMLLDGGVYEGKRLLSEEFIREATSPQIAKSDTTFYGYSFWMRKGNPSFHCGGMLGQKIFVDRKLGRVIAWQAIDKEKKTDILLNFLYGL